MSAKHVLSDVNPAARTAICAVDGPVRIYLKGEGRFRCAIKSNELEKVYYAGSSRRRAKKRDLALARLRKGDRLMRHSIWLARRKHHRAIALDLVASWLDNLPVSQVRQATRLEGSELRGVATEIGVLATSLHRRATRLRRRGYRSDAA